MWIQTPGPELSRRFDRVQTRYVPLASLDSCAAIVKRTLLAGSSIQTRCVEYCHIISRRDIIGEEAGATSFKCMVRYARTGPALSTQHGLDIGWSATCDMEFIIVVHINIAMSYGSSHMHAMQAPRRHEICLHHTPGLSGRSSKQSSFGHSSTAVWVSKRCSGYVGLSISPQALPGST